MKVLFLDHQGVMYIKNHPSPGDFDDFDKKAIEILNEVLDSDPDIQIVVSSDWKRWKPFEELQTFYERQGIHRIPIAKTPWLATKYNVTYRKQRADEILEWLSLNPNVTHWVAIDDLDLSSYLDRFVKTDYNKGIVEQGIKEQIMYLLK